MNSQKDLQSAARLAAGKPVEDAVASARLADLHRLSWKRALGGIVSPALRLHNYRTAHNRLLHNALCELDSPANRDCRGGE